ncbi:MAG TPA: hypothetical protein VGG95_03835 [Edaphobacter sp.]|jgi:hypothetical protein
MKIIAALAAILLVTTGTTAGHSQDKKLTKDQLPAAVAAAVDRESNGAAVKGFATELEHGKRVYEAETSLNGHSRDLQFSPAGDLLEVEEEIDFSTLSAPIQASLKSKTNGAEIKKVESLVKKGKLVAYEATIAKGGRTREIQVGPSGETLAHEE